MAPLKGGRIVSQSISVAPVFQSVLILKTNPFLLSIDIYLRLCLPTAPLLHLWLASTSPSPYVAPHFFRGGEEAE